MGRRDVLFLLPPSSSAGQVRPGNPNVNILEPEFAFELASVLEPGVMTALAAKFSLRLPHGARVEDTASIFLRELQSWNIYR